MKQNIKQRIADIRRGNVPVGYKRTQQGITPVHWEERSLNDILLNIVRKVAKPQTAYWRLGVKSHAKGTFRELVEDPEIVDMDELYSVQANDLIVNITFAREHAIAIVNEGDAGLLVSHRFPTYVFKPNASPDFYKYVITQKWMQKQLDLISPGGAGRNRVMNKNAFLKIPCCVPPLDEQRRIAEILGCCDRGIALKKELIAEKRRQKKALMQKLLNPDSGFRLPGFSGEWERTRIKNLSQVQTGATPSTTNSDFWGGDIPWMASGELNQKHVFNVLGRITRQGLNNSGKKLLPPNCVLIGLAGQGKTRGTVAINHIALCINQSIAAILPSNRMCPEFLYQNLDSRYNELRKISSGDGLRGGLNIDLIKNLYIQFPSFEEQQAIADILSAAEREIDLLEQELAQHQQKKKSLMQLLLTGIARV